MKKIYYSYLLNRERDHCHAMSKRLHSGSEFHLEKDKAKFFRHQDCMINGKKPGKLVKITLETIDD